MSEERGDKSQGGKLPVKDVAISMAMEMLRQTRSHALNHRIDEIIEVAKKWGASIPSEQEGQFKNELREAIAEPTNWPSITFNTSTSTVVTSKAAPEKPSKGGSDKASTLKAADFPLLKAPEGRIIKCPAKISGGKNARDACGKECKRVLFEHDVTNPECAAFECNHAFCGTHITKVHAASGNLAKARLQKGTNSGNPVTLESEDGKSNTINTDILNVKDDVKSKSASATLNKLFEMADDEDD